MPIILAHETPAHTANALPITLYGKLVGREKSLAQVYSHLKTHKAVLLYGAAGIGKTALAGTLASAYTELPGGVLWLNVHGSPLDELIVRVGRAYGDLDIANSDVPSGMVGAVASTLSSHKPLLVLDGKPNLPAAADFIRRCADGLPALVVANEPVDGPWTPVEVRALDEQAAVALLRALAGLEGQAGIEDDLAELVSILDYTPLAIAVAAGTIRLTKQTPAAYLQTFEQIPSSAGADAKLLALTVGFRSLNSALQGLMLMMGALFTGGGSGELLSLVSGAPPETIQQVMTMLSASYLVDRFERGDAPYYRLHEVTRLFAETWLRSSGRLESLQMKVRDTLVEYIKKFSGSHDRLAAEMENIVAAARWSADSGDRDTVNQIVVSLMQAGDFVNGGGYVYELLALRRLAASFTTPFPAYPPPPPPETAEPAAPSLWGRAEYPPPDVSGAVIPGGDKEDFDEDLEAEPDAFEDELEDEFDEDFDEEEDFEDEGQIENAALPGLETEALPEGEAGEVARLQAALRQARQQGDGARKIELLAEIGERLAEQGQHNEAIPIFTELLSDYEALDETEEMLRTLDTLSALMVKTENSGAAVMHATRGIHLAEELDDEETHMHLLMTLGDARQQLGDSGEAVRAYGQALEIARNRDDGQNESLALFKLGGAQLDNSDPDAAAQTWEQALRLFRAQGKRDYEGRVLGSLGTAYGEMGRWTESINFHTSALHIAREVKDKEEEALQLSNLGYAAVEANQLGEAVLRYRQALHLAYQANNRDNIVSAIVDLARLLVESPRHLGIVEMLINEAAALEPNDRDVIRLSERVTNEKKLAEANGVQLLPVNGTPQQYAANAYSLLEG
ncbi:MAG: tetratricopeptide repeat protein [Chloroflexi bacterium]|nr:tetratricopeptide repeat protein [Chloroflexota bacterium]